MTIQQGQATNLNISFIPSINGWWFYSVSIFLQCISVFMIVVSVLLVFDQWIWMLISIMLLLVKCFRVLILIFIAQIDTDWCSGTCYAYFGLDAWLSVAVCVLLFVMALSSGYSATVGKRKNFTGDKQWMSTKILSQFCVSTILE